MLLTPARKLLHNAKEREETAWQNLMVGAGVEPAILGLLAGEIH